MCLLVGALAARSPLCAILIMVKPLEIASGGREHGKLPSDYLLEVNDNSSQSLTVMKLKGGKDKQRFAGAVGGGTIHSRWYGGTEIF